MVLLSWEVLIMEIKNIDLKTQRKFAGKHVAIIKGKVVGWGATVKEAFEMAKKKYPSAKSEEILLRYIPQEELLIL